MHFLRTGHTHAMVSSGRTASACLEGLDPQSLDVCKKQAQQGEENCVLLLTSPAHKHLSPQEPYETAHILGASVANKLATLAAVMPPADQAKPFAANTAEL